MLKRGIAQVQCGYGNVDCGVDLATLQVDNLILWFGQRLPYAVSLLLM